MTAVTFSSTKPPSRETPWQWARSRAAFKYSYVNLTKWFQCAPLVYLIFSQTQLKKCDKCEFRDMQAPAWWREGRFWRLVIENFSEVALLPKLLSKNQTNRSQLHAVTFVVAYGCRNKSDIITMSKMCRNQTQGKKNILILIKLIMCCSQTHQSVSSLWLDRNENALKWAGRVKELIQQMAAFVFFTPASPRTDKNAGKLYLGNTSSTGSLLMTFLLDLAN